MEDDYEDYNYKPTTHHHTNPATPTHHTTTTNNPSSHHHAQPPPSTSDLMSSAQYLAGAARYAFSHETDKIDKAKAAEAAADLVAAAKQYGHLEEKSFGKYFDQAETYLHKYGHSSGPTGGAAAAGSHGGVHHPGAAEAAAARPSGHKHQAAADYEDEEEESGDGGGGYGDYMKIAQGLLKKF